MWGNIKDAELEHILNSIRDHSATDGEVLQQGLSSLEARRIQKLNSLLQYAACVYTSEPDVLVTSPEPFSNSEKELSDDLELDKVSKEVTCSDALAQLLANQLISAQEQEAYHMCRVAWDHAHIGRELQAALKELRQWKKVAWFWDTLANVNTQVKNHKILNACRDVNEIRQNTEDLSVDMHRALQETVAWLEHEVASEIQHIIVFQSMAPALRDQKKDSTERMGQLLDGALILGVQDRVAEVIAEAVLQGLLLPVARGKADRAKSKDENHMIPGQTEKYAYRIVKHLCEDVMLGRSEWIECMGKCLWSRFASEYKHHLLQAYFDRYNDTKSPNDLDAFIKTESFARKLEVKASKLGLLSDEMPITAASNELISRVLENMRIDILVKGRTLLATPVQEDEIVQLREGSSILGVPVEVAHVDAMRSTCEQQEHVYDVLSRDIFAEMEDCGAIGLLERPLAVYRSHVDLTALLMSAWRESRIFSPESSMHLMSTIVQDIFNLAMALRSNVPLHEAALPYMAAIRYMCCLYLAKVLCALPFWRVDLLNATMKSKVNWNILSMRMEMLGRSLLQNMLTSQKAELDDEMSLLCHWRYTVDAKEVITKKKAVHKIRNFFQRLGKSFNGSDVPNYLILDIFADLLSMLFSNLTCCILDMEDISEEVSEQIPLILEDIVPLTGGNGLIECVANARFGIECDNVDELNGFTEELIEKVPGFARLKALLEMMGLSSKEIAQRWTDGSLKAIGFSAKEIQHLIMALFEDNMFREASLVQIE